MLRVGGNGNHGSLQGLLYILMSFNGLFLLSCLVNPSRQAPYVFAKSWIHMPPDQSRRQNREAENGYGMLSRQERLPPVAMAFSAREGIAIGQP